VKTPSIRLDIETGRPTTADRHDTIVQA